MCAKSHDNKQKKKAARRKNCNIFIFPVSLKWKLSVPRTSQRDFSKACTEPLVYLSQDANWVPCFSIHLAHHPPWRRDQLAGKPHYLYVSSLHSTFFVFLYFLFFSLSFSFYLFIIQKPKYVSKTNEKVKKVIRESDRKI